MRLNVVTGEVLECQRLSSTHTHGDGNYVGSTVSYWTDLFIKDAKGQERRIEINADVPARAGNKIAAFYIDAGYGPELAAVHNSSINETWKFKVGKARGLKLLIAAVLLVIGIAAAAFAALLLIGAISGDREVLVPAGFLFLLATGFIIPARKLHRGLGPSAERAIEGELQKAGATTLHR